MAQRWPWYSVWFPCNFVYCFVSEASSRTAVFVSWCIKQRQGTRSSAGVKRHNVSLVRSRVRGYALHEKELQTQKGIDPLVKQPGTKSPSRPADKPVANRLSTARQPVVNFSLVPRSCFYMGFPCFVPPKNCPGQLFSVPWRARWTVVSLAHRPAAVLGASTRRHPTPPCRAPPRPAALRTRRPPRRCAPPRPVPPVICSGFGFDRFWDRFPDILRMITFLGVSRRRSLSVAVVGLRGCEII